MALEAEKRIPDVTLEDNGFLDGQILRASDINRIVAILKAGVNENYKEFKNILNGGTVIVISDDSINAIRKTKDNFLEVASDTDPNWESVHTLGQEIYNESNEKVTAKRKLKFTNMAVSIDGDTIVIDGSGSIGPTGQGVPKGGFAGQILRKVSNESFDTMWADSYTNDEIDQMFTTIQNQIGVVSSELTNILGV